MHMQRAVGAVGVGLGIVGLGTLGVFAIRRARRKALGEPICVAMTINHSPDEVYARWLASDRLREWDAEITEDVPGRSIAWESTTKEMPMRGRITFTPAPQGRGTEVLIEVHHRFDRPELTRELRRFKQIVETGEVMVSAGPAVLAPAPEGGVR